jgi:glycosyltransferase involved in cell wall biosynthesis
MKVVHVETGRHLYGGAQQVIWLLDGLARRDVDGLLVCISGSDIDRVARRRGLPVQNIACGGDHDLGFAWRLRGLLTRERPDLVHCHSRRGGDFAGGLAASLAAVPAIVSRRVDSEESRFVSRLRYRPFRRIVAISEHIAAMLRNHTSDADRIVVIRSAVDAESIPVSPDCEAFREEFDIDEGDFAIAVIGQLIPRKGHRFLFDVIPNIRDAHPNLRVVLFGTGEEEPRLRALAKQLTLGATVRFAGFREDLDTFLACIDLLVHPATEEGLGVAMLKAAAASIPVVAFDVAGSREAVLHGRTGVLVPARDVWALQKAISTLIEEPTMCREFGAAGRRRMQEEFSVQTMVDSHLDLYQSALNEKY